MRRAPTQPQHSSLQAFPSTTRQTRSSIDKANLDSFACDCFRATCMLHCRRWSQATTTLNTGTNLINLLVRPRGRAADRDSPRSTPSPVHAHTRHRRPTVLIETTPTHNSSPGTFQPTESRTSRCQTRTTKNAPQTRQPSEQRARLGLSPSTFARLSQQPLSFFLSHPFSLVLRLSVACLSTLLESHAPRSGPATRS